MKLSMDCVRAVMLCVEEHTDFDHYCYFIRYARADILDMLGEGPIDPPTYQVELEAKFDNDDILPVSSCLCTSAPDRESAL